jgi:hypothetical protein
MTDHDLHLARLPIAVRNDYLDREAEALREARLDAEAERGIAAREAREAADEDAGEARNLAAYERSMGW